MGLTLFDAGVLIGLLDDTDAPSKGPPASALAESLVDPARQGAPAVTQVRDFLAALTLEVVPLDLETSVAAAELRARHGNKLRLPDSLVVATAITRDAQTLVTTDRGWPTRRVLRLQAQLVVL